MMHRLSLCLLACLFLLPAPAMAEEGDLLMNDSVYYTMDDGIMTPEEMELEANQIYRMCDLNHFQKNNYNCECLAGAFLIEREKLGPMVPQINIFNDITRTKPVACANTERIAGSNYTSCMNMAGRRRAMKGDAHEYCTCVGNKVANDFTKNPRLVSSHIKVLNYNALLFCEKPENRPKTASSEAAKIQDSKTAN